MIALNTPCWIRNSWPKLQADGHICIVIKHSHPIGTYTVSFRNGEWGAFERNLIPLTPPSWHADCALEQA